MVKKLLKALVKLFIYEVVDITFKAILFLDKRLVKCAFQFVIHINFLWEG